MTNEVSTLSVSARDVQWLTALVALSTVLLNRYATEDMVVHNIESLEELFYREYSGTEGEALKRQLYALLPLDTPIVITHVREPMSPSTSSLVS